jgi:NIMA (never in mitosis gene a)-related kinase 2
VRVMKREEEVAEAMKRREEEILEAVRRREAELGEAWMRREREIREEMERTEEGIRKREQELREEEERLRELKRQLELAGEFVERHKASLDLLSSVGWKKGRGKAPLDEVQNIMASPTPFTCIAPILPPPLPAPAPILETPVNRRLSTIPPPSAMKGIVFTLTGEPLSTPAPSSDLARLLVDSPRVGLNFAKIFEEDEEEVDGEETVHAGARPVDTSLDIDIEDDRDQDGDARLEEDSGSDTDTDIPPPSPSDRRTSCMGILPPQPQPLNQTARSIGRPRTSVQLTRAQSLAVLPSSSSVDPVVSSTSTSASTSRPPSLKPARPSARHTRHQSLSTASSRTTSPTTIIKSLASLPSPQYDEADLPSPFLKRIDRDRDMDITSSPVTPHQEEQDDPPSPFLMRVERERPAPPPAAAAAARKRPSNANRLRTVAAANSVSSSSSATAVGASVKSTKPSVKSTSRPSVNGAAGRPSIASARRAQEEAKRVLLKG